MKISPWLSELLFPFSLPCRFPFRVFPSVFFPFVSAGLECVAVPLAVHQPAGDAPELPVEGADETVPGVMVAGTNLIEQDGQVTLSLARHCCSLNTQIN